MDIKIKIPRGQSCGLSGDHQCDFYLFKDSDPEDRKILEFLQHKVKHLPYEYMKVQGWEGIGKYADGYHLVALEGNWEDEMEGWSDDPEAGIEYNNEICGWAVFGRVDKMSWELYLLGTRADKEPEYRGVGSCLIREMERFIRSREGRMIYINPFASSIPFYVKQGYDLVQLKNESTIGGKRVDDVLYHMYKALDSEFEIKAYKLTMKRVLSYAGRLF